MKKIISLLILLVLSSLMYGQVGYVSCNSAPKNRDKETGKEYYYGDIDGNDMIDISLRIRRGFSYKGLTRDSIKTSLGEKTIMFLFISEDGVLEKYLVGRKSWVNGCSIFEKQVLPQVKNLPFQAAKCDGKRVPYTLHLVLHFDLRHIYSYLDEDNETTTSD